MFANPALARALGLLAADGREAYYKGEIATRIVAFSEAHGGFFSSSDFASHRGEWVEPISTTYRGTTVWELPPNGQGLAALEMLNILENYDLASLGRGSADFWHLHRLIPTHGYGDDEWRCRDVRVGSTAGDST